jgi:hypothetical protein
MTSTKAITPTEPEAAAPVAAPWRRRGEAFLPLAVGACLVVLGLPRLISAVVTEPVQPTLEALQAGDRVSEEGLARLTGRAALARNFSSSGRVAVELAAAKLAQAARLPERAQTERGELVQDAVALLEEGLAAMPANGFGWAQLAQARLLQDGPGPAAVDAWRMSVLTAPAEPQLALWRARSGIGLASHFIEGDHALLDRQIRFAWQAEPERLAAYAKSAGPEVLTAVRTALIDQPEDLKRFEALVR